MSLTFFRRNLLALMVVPVLTLAGNASGQSQPNGKAPSGNGTLTAPANSGPANSGPANSGRFNLPQTKDVSVLVKFLSDCLTFEPKNEKDLEEFQEYAPMAMTQAAQQIIELETDAKSDNFRLAQKYLLAVDVMAAADATPDERRELIGMVAENLQDPQMDADDIDIAIALAEGLEMAGDIHSARQAYESFAKTLKQHKDPMVAELAQLMAGSARRLGLPGQNMDVTGNRVDGKPFQWNQLRGKVVLVDFWATWCGPCRAEFPNLAKLYDAYRGRGFEVVAISVDEDRAALDEFLKTNPMPWITVHESQQDANSTANRYGISALPTSILVDKDGRVISLTARGESLQKQLEKMLGPVTR